MSCSGTTSTSPIWPPASARSNTGPSHSGPTRPPTMAPSSSEPISHGHTSPYPELNVFEPNSRQSRRHSHQPGQADADAVSHTAPQGAVQAAALPSDSTPLTSPVPGPNPRPGLRLGRPVGGRGWAVLPGVGLGAFCSQTDPEPCLVMRFQFCARVTSFISTKVKAKNALKLRGVRI